jgi:hypothetical protein
MPYFSNKKLASAANLYLANIKKAEIDMNNNTTSMENMNLDSSMNFYQVEPPIDTEISINDKCCQTEPGKDESTQTNFAEKSKSITTLHETLDVALITDFINVFDSIVDLGEKKKRVFSCIIYLIMRRDNASFDKCKDVLKQLDLCTAYTCHEWVLKVIENDDAFVLLRDRRSEKECSNFYETFPELEIEAKAFVMSAGERPNCSFTVLEFAQFIDDRFRELYVESIDEASDSTKFVRLIYKIKFSFSFCD